MGKSYLSALGEFLSFLSVERNLSRRTSDAYHFDLRKMQEFLKKKGTRDLTVDRIGADDVRNYLLYLQVERDYKSAALARAISSIRMFLKFCVRRGYVRKSPAEDIATPRKPRKLPLYLIDSELIKLLNAPDKQTVTGTRDYAILVTLGLTGLRLQELVQLNIGDLDFERITIRAYGKGAKERIIPMNRLVKDALEGYLSHRERTVHMGEGAVFLNRFANRLSGRMIENIVKKYVRKAGIAKSKISPHKLRHTFATLLHMRDVDLLEIQKLLGHASILSTEIYTHTDPGKLKNAVNKLDKLTGRQDEQE